ncbi:neuromedin-K receptor-like [Saccoglossus kowalevskii]|uniref:Probable G-protein coupled receptor 83-like n=1 Tax=Saccoglossus kowalevskii TaxID=10224 RepID=A0ABM0ML51_SACKO|nr:PREDICTED: probable G-protein coupled receptor 83-like [Saccoglossus kowalevskii]
MWFSAIICGVPELYAYTVYDKKLYNLSITVCGSHGQNIPDSIRYLGVVFTTCVCYIVPLFLITVNYSKVVLFIWKRERQVSHTVGKSSSISKVKVKIVKMLVLTTTAFALLWFHFFALLSYEKLTGRDDSTDNWTIIHNVELCVLGLSAVYNPILYGICNKPFRIGYAALFFRSNRQCAVQPTETNNTQSGDEEVPTTSQARGRVPHKQHVSSKTHSSIGELSIIATPVINMRSSLHVSSWEHNATRVPRHHSKV